MSGWIRCLGMVLAIMAADARAQGPGSNAKVITWGPATPSSEIYVGVLGEIAKPGVYRLDANSLNLTTLIRHAGGLTDDASGSIRVVRQDRIVENLFYSPQSNIALLAGDLLVVESRRAQAAISRMYDIDPKIRAEFAKEAEAALRPDPTGIQVAFLNVLERPVVVKIKHENARVGRVVQMLDQPPELAQSVRVIGPERLVSQSAAALPRDAAIADGSVLYFPRNAVNRNKLPSFPIPYDSEIATGAVPSLIGGPSGQSPELRNVGQLPPLVARQSVEPYLPNPLSGNEQAKLPLPSESISLPPAIPQPSTPGEPEVMSPPTPVVNSRPRIATAPFMGQPRITSSSSIEILPQQSAPPDHTAQTSEPPPADSRSAQSQMSVSDAPLEVIDSEAIDAETVEPPKSSSFSLVQMIGISAVMGLLVGLAVLTRKQMERRGRHVSSVHEEFDEIRDQLARSSVREIPRLEETNPSAAADIPPVVGAAEIRASNNIDTGSSVAEWIDRLTGNQIPIEEETPVFPMQIALQGRIVPPPVFRVDQGMPQPLEGPHFAVSPRIEPSTASDENPANEKVIDTVDIAHQSRPGKPHFMRRRAGDKTIAVAATREASAALDLKHSETPVTDALRQLQGGQS